MIGVFSAQDWVLIIGAIGAAFGTAAAAVIKAVASIKKEFRPNGGGSMRDAIDGLHDKLDDVAATQAQHTMDDEARFTRLEQRLGGE